MEALVFVSVSSDFCAETLFVVLLLSSLATSKLKQKLDFDSVQSVVVAEVLFACSLFLAVFSLQNAALGAATVFMDGSVISVKQQNNFKSGELWDT